MSHVRALLWSPARSWSYHFRVRALAAVPRSFSTVVVKHAGHEHGHSHSHDANPKQTNIQADSFNNFSHSHGFFSGHGHSHTSKRDILQAGNDASRITWAGIWVNVVLSVSKGITGVMYNSPSLLADAAHSMSDLVSDAVTLVSVTFSRKPPSNTMPYGYGKAETLGALGVSSLLIVGAAAIGTHSYHSLMELMQTMSNTAAAGQTMPDYMMHPIGLGIVVASIISKEVLYQFTLRIGERMNSAVLIANAWHHRTDSMSSAVAFVGIGGSLLGYHILDPIGGLAVCALILAMGLDIGWKSIQELLDGTAPKETLIELRQVTNSLPQIYPDVRDIRNVRARRMGPFLLVDLTVQFPPMISTSASCLTIQAITNHIKQEMKDVTEVFVHLEVENEEMQRRTFKIDLPQTEEQTAKIQRLLLSSAGRVEQVVDIKRHFFGGKSFLQVFVKLASKLSLEEANEIAREGCKAIKSELGVDVVQIIFNGAQTETWGAFKEQ